jgi:hypothetical protein
MTIIEPRTTYRFDVEEILTALKNIGINVQHTTFDDELNFYIGDSFIAIKVKDLTKVKYNQTISEAEIHFKGMILTIFANADGIHLSPKD